MPDHSEPRPAPLASFYRDLSADLSSHDGDWARPGFHALAVYRLGNLRVGSRVGRALLRRTYAFLNTIVRNVYGIEINASSRLGRGIRFLHTRAVVIHGQAVVGDGCILDQRVTIGAVGNAQHWIAPTIGDGVVLGAGSVIVGAIRVGDNANIGPNAVVMADVASGAILVAPPTRIYQPSESSDV